MHRNEQVTHSSRCQFLVKENLYLYKRLLQISTNTLHVQHFEFFFDICLFRDRKEGRNETVEEVLWENGIYLYIHYDFTFT